MEVMDFLIQYLDPMFSMLEVAVVVGLPRQVAADQVVVETEKAYLMEMAQMEPTVRAAVAAEH
jgi:hypothetical protein